MFLASPLGHNANNKFICIDYKFIGASLQFFLLEEKNTGGGRHSPVTAGSFTF
jgi:hypothetical protein